MLDSIQRQLASSLSAPLAQLSGAFTVQHSRPLDTSRANELFKKACYFESEEACGMVRR
jgi:hypothetical protein